jgi:hypothetical protein
MRYSDFVRGRVCGRGRRGFVAKLRLSLEPGDLVTIIVALYACQKQETDALAKHLEAWLPQNRRRKRGSAKAC